jgi:chemotaxis methyl-accepting protein methylase
MELKQTKTPRELGREAVINTPTRLAEFYGRPENSDRYFEKIKDLFSRHHDLDLESYRAPFLHRRLHYRISKLDLRSYKEYLEYLDVHPEEPDLFKDVVTIHVTGFFRDDTPFRFLEKYLLPRIDREKRGSNDKKIRILSAPCSTGEEPYSLAIIADYLITEGNISSPVEIVACDIEPGAIATAKEGIYPEEALKNISRVAVIRNFKHLKDNNYQVKPSIKSYVKFLVYDLLKPAPAAFGTFDLISCRNFLIYIARENQQTIIQNLIPTLRPAGYMMLGKTEGFPLLEMCTFAQINAVEHVYQYLPGRTKPVPAEQSRN